mmetsp:Transcript_35209/g.74973  ORF Transcript_35209/g.74973 Transcript_35209/m.74973 type:complete len:486 (+) Transcript_35209:113-1570(+)|eukprot:CAMPEP_0206455186 /NCGR_PEP_ID=MMETSP0324_2-20121206/21601_1 /ASSEMBLY_ACC=CAM_ASM_000836 /TAXON_ID=2866 /ORGANISM="Crypthecodinium cohnii, Strain Seligo" /LENGTH=485 /DNA_ID=CAMNT_0053925839 /DNA_START=97 /DNA_END=1554 /DNA_ORIENTATION=-
MPGAPTTATKWQLAAKKSAAVSSSLKVMGKVIEESTYDSLVREAKDCVGHGGLDGAFPEEWSAQLLFQCHDSSEGYKVVIFCPYFLLPVTEDADEMDRALRFVLYNMDKVRTEKYIFVYCFLGMDWSNPAIATRLRFVYDHLPDNYRENLVKFYVLHKSMSFQMSLWGFRMMLSNEFWNKIEYIDSLDDFCQKMQPTDHFERAELRRKFPFLVHRRDAEALGKPLPGMLGLTIKVLSEFYGVDFFDRTTGKSYPRLPPPIIFLCEALEREGAEQDFQPEAANEEQVQKLREALDQGQPLDPDTPCRVLWAGLLGFLQAIPGPILTFETMGDLRHTTWAAGDRQEEKKFLTNLFKTLPEENAYLALYIASFLHTMCSNSVQRGANTLQNGGGGGAVGKTLSRNAAGKLEEEEHEPTLMTSEGCAVVFSTCFLRPSAYTDSYKDAVLKVSSLVETLINNAEEPDLWIGKPPSTDHFGTFDSSSSDEE